MSELKWSGGEDHKILDTSNRNNFPKYLIDEIENKLFFRIGYNYLGEAIYWKIAKPISHH